MVKNRNIELCICFVCVIFVLLHQYRALSGYSKIGQELSRPLNRSAVSAFENVKQVQVEEETSKPSQDVLVLVAGEKAQIKEVPAPAPATLTLSKKNESSRAGHLATKTLPQGIQSVVQPTDETPPSTENVTPTPQGLVVKEPSSQIAEMNVLSSFLAPGALRSIKNIPSSLYFCGYDTIKNLGLHLFPEFPEGPLPLPSNYSSLQPQSVVVYGMYGNCHGIKYQAFRDKFVGCNFPAKIIYANGEPFGNALQNSRCPQNEYQIGGAVDESDHEHIMSVTLAAWAVLRFTETQRQMLFEPLQRPINTGKHNAVIYINGNCVPFRQEAALNISAFVPIHFGGPCKVKTTNGVVKRMGRHDNWESNWKIFSDYKYCLCMENSDTKHYVTEKIVNAFMGGCLPIYYGTPESLEIFNADAFIYYDIGNPGPALDEIRYLESDPEAYKRKFEQPILRNGSQTMEDHFSLSDSIGNGKLKGKIRVMLGFDP
jgi:hypothetical protein